MNGKFQNNIDELKELESYRYENIFKVYETGKKNYFFYNIAKKIVLPDNLDNNFFDFITLRNNIPLTTISFQIYGTTYLWWLILIVNNIENPVKKLPVGKKIRYIKPNLIKTVVDNIKSQLQ